MTYEQDYLNILQSLHDDLSEGQLRDNRTGVKTVSQFGHRLRIDLSDGKVPLMGSKRVDVKSVLGELAWFLKGDTTLEGLRKYGVTIWDEWAVDGALGPIYGAQWRSWPTADIGVSIDQIAGVVASLRNNPDSRRHIVSAWNPADLPDESLSPHANVQAGRMALAPCHLLMQFHAPLVPGGNGRRRLICQMYQRSADWFLGVPFNALSYAILTHILAQQLDMDAHELIMVFGDAHIYANHLEAAQTQLMEASTDHGHINMDAARRARIYVIPDTTVDTFEPSSVVITTPTMTPPVIRAPVAV